MFVKLVQAPRRPRWPSKGVFWTSKSKVVKTKGPNILTFDCEMCKVPKAPRQGKRILLVLEAPIFPKRKLGVLPRNALQSPKAACQDGAGLAMSLHGALCHKCEPWSKPPYEEVTKGLRKDAHWRAILGFI